MFAFSFNWLRRSSGARAHPVINRRRCRLQLESLERRDVPTTGLLDLTFGGDGRVTTPFDLGSDHSDVATDVAVQPDGKVVVAGYVQVDGISPKSTDFAVARYNRDGSLDPTFSGDGKAVIPLNLGGGDDHEEAHAIAIQPDGKILVAGFTEDADGNQFAICRLHANGELDTSFGAGGKVIDSTPNLTTGVNDIVLQPDGKIVMAGWSHAPLSFGNFMVWRLHPNGTLDASFNGGSRIVDFGGADSDRAEGVALTPDGKIVAVGNSVSAFDAEAVVCRLTSAGALDATFDGDGQLSLSFGGDSAAYDVAVQVDGNIVVVGQSELVVGIARLTPTGAFDTAFDGDGRRVIPVGSAANHDRAMSVLVQPDGKIVVGGETFTAAGNYDMFAMRLLTHGAPDPSYFLNGVFTYDLIDGAANSLDSGAALALGADGIVLAGTMRVPGEDDEFAVIRIIRDSWVVAAPDQGGLPSVQILTPAGTPLRQFKPFGPKFKGGIRVALGDINGDGAPEIFCATGSGSTARVLICDGHTLAPIRQIKPYGPKFKGGVYVAVADVLGSSAKELVVSPGPGAAPIVKIYDPLTGALIRQIKVFSNSFKGGVRLATGNTTGTPQHELLVAGESGMAPVVRVFSAETSALLQKVRVFGPKYRGGVFLASGDVTGDGRDDLIVGPGGKMAPQVRIFDLTSGALFRQHTVFGPGFKGGVRVAAAQLNSVGPVEVIAAAAKPKGPLVQVFDGVTGAMQSYFAAFGPQMKSGLFIAGSAR